MRAPKLEPVTEPAMAVVRVPIIPSWLVMLANSLATIGALTATSLATLPDVPRWLPFTISALASIAAFLAGQASPGLVVPNRPLAPIAAVPVLLALSSGCAAAAGNADGWHAGLLLGTSSILAGLAGRSGPQQAVTAPRGRDV